MLNYHPPKRILFCGGTSNPEVPKLQLCGESGDVLQPIENCSTLTPRRPLVMSV
jgi:hypothetical protein